MKRSIFLTTLIITAVVSSLLSNPSAQTITPLINGNQQGPEKGKSPFVEIKVRKEICNLVNSWDKKIWLFTSKESPLKTLEGLQKDDIAVWGLELMTHAGELYKLLGITETGVRVIGTGNPIFSGMEDPPRLFITWSSYESHLKGGIRVALKENGAESGPSRADTSLVHQLRVCICEVDTAAKTFTVTPWSPEMETWLHSEPRTIFFENTSVIESGKVSGPISEIINGQSVDEDIRDLAGLSGQRAIVDVVANGEKRLVVRKLVLVMLFGGESIPAMVGAAGAVPVDTKCPCMQR